MIDPDLKIELDKVNDNLAVIKNKHSGGGVWRAFFNGMFGALGYVAGLAIVVVILGWILQKTGLLPAFEDQVKNFTNLVSGAEKLIPKDSNSSSTSSGASQSSNSGDIPTLVTLPDGRQIQVNLPKGY